MTSTFDPKTLSVVYAAGDIEKYGVVEEVRAGKAEALVAVIKIPQGGNTGQEAH